jgi:hypothetical protein
MPAPPATPYTVCPRAPAARRLAAAAAHQLSADTQCGRLRGPCCWYSTVPYPSTPCCGPLRSCILRAGLGMRRPASHHARPAWWSGGGRGKRAKKGTYIGSVHPPVHPPYPASFARLKHHLNLKHPSQSLPRITHQVLWLFLGPWSASRCWYVCCYARMIADRSPSCHELFVTHLQ